MGDAAKTINMDHSIETINGATTSKRSVVLSIPVASSDRRESLQLKNVGVVNCIPVYNSGIDVTSYAHLADLRDVVTSKPINGHTQVDILIGQDHSEALLPLDVRSGVRGQPFAVKYLLGWTLNGKVSHISSAVNQPVLPDDSKFHSVYGSSELIRCSTQDVKHHEMSVTQTIKNHVENVPATAVPLCSMVVSRATAVSHVVCATCLHPDIVDSQMICYIPQNSAATSAVGPVNGVGLLCNGPVTADHNFFTDEFIL